MVRKIEQQMFTTEQTAASLGVSEETVRRHANVLGGRKVGRVWRFPEDALVANYFRNEEIKRMAAEAVA